LTPAAPTADVDEIVAQTLAAYATGSAQAVTATPDQLMLIEVFATGTAEAILTQSAMSPTETIAPTATFTPTAIQEENAPDPLPVTNTGVILNNGECFNFDNGQTLAAPDGQCDVWLVEAALFRQVNEVQISGYVTQSPPSRTHCAEGRYESGDLAVQTDLFYCFITAEGHVGFIVVRDYRGGIPSTGIVFDYWVFQ
jgi:hypothetical protein